MIQKKNTQAVSVSSGARLNQASREPLLYLEFNKPNKQNVSEMNLFRKKSAFPSIKIIVYPLIVVRNETTKHNFLKSVKINT